MAYSVTWDETTPAGTEARSLGDDRIRELKKQIRERMEDKIVTDWDSDPVLQKIIPAGTKMLIYADTAPSGWTIDATVDDKLVYISKGSAAGGQTGGGAHSTGSWTISGIAADSHTLTTAEMPAHTHTERYYTGSGAIAEISDALNKASILSSSLETASTGGGGGHTHTCTHTPAWRPSAYCMIVCAKD